MSEETSLAALLLINCAERRLTKEERKRALELMGQINEGETCFLCGEQAVGDVRLCGGHAFYAMATQK